MVGSVISLSALTPAVGSAVQPADGISISVTQQGEEYLKGLFEWIDEGKKDDYSNSRQQCEANPWLEHTMWDRHIGPYKKWAVQMIQPIIDRENTKKNKTTAPATQDETPANDENKNRAIEPLTAWSPTQ